MNQNDLTLSLPADGYSPIFIGGLYRSGTTLMRRLLNSHPHIACERESKLFQDNRLEGIYTNLRTIWPTILSPSYEFDPHTVNQVMAGLIHSIFMPYSQKQGKQRWAEKTPKNILFIDTLFALFPAAHFIHMIRDPRDALCSVRQKAAKDKRDKPHWATWTPKQVATEWCRQINYGLAWREQPDCYREVRYEELVTQPEASLRSLFAFLDEPWAASMLENNATFSTSVGRWRSEMSAAETEEMIIRFFCRLDYLQSPLEGNAEENSIHDKQRFYDLVYGSFWLREKYSFRDH
jgi:protein-tyrosine sulfotransferase